MGRIALRDTKLPVGGGPKQDLPVVVPEGTMVVMSYYSVHRKTSVFGQDVDEFRPDRWNDVRLGQWEFMGFGAGNRACLGQQKALIEASYVLVRTARAFTEIHSKDSKPWQGELKMTCKSANGCKVSLK
jgi:cytochrome P450